jgi:prepilin-type N-terminal cleavage/methylation domain-containing protein
MTRGFTLLELMIVISILTIVGGLSYVALESSTVSMATASAQADLMDDLRSTMMVMTQQLQIAAKTGDDSLEPILEEVEVVENPAEGSPVELAFQIPLDNTGQNWSDRIRLRFVNEDANGNDALDAGEDLNGDGALTQCVVRLQDVNGDGFVDPDSESFPLGAANNIVNAQFVRNGDLVDITLNARKVTGPHQRTPVTARMTARVYLIN